MTNLLLDDPQTDKHVLGIITKVGFGMRDFHGEPSLWFTVNIYPSSACLQCLFGKDITKFLTSGENDIYDIKDLENKSVIMLSENGMSKIVGLWK
jgi:hypothetical protein